MDAIMANGGAMQQLHPLDQATLDGITAGIKAGVSRVVGELSAGQMAQGYDMAHGPVTHISNLGQVDPAPKPAMPTGNGQG